MLLKKLKKDKAKIYLIELKDSTNIKAKKNCFLKDILYKYYHINIDKEKIEYTSFGKPNLKSICFNCSDTSKYIAIIIGNKDVGIDIENNRKIDKIMTSKILDEKEMKEKIDNLYLLSHWVGKEAYVKYKGTGIISDFNSFNLKDKLKKHNHFIKKENNFILYAFAEEKIDKNIVYVIE